jgi:hypothetical protein
MVSSLSHQYRVIGSELLRCEETPFSSSNQEAFQQGVAFISLELLESYLEDLLDLEVCEAQLHLHRPNRRFGSMLLGMLGAAGALAVGVYVSFLGTSLGASLLLTLTAALPFAVLFHFASRQSTVRRLKFAQLLSQEISRRRGGDGTTSVVRSRQLLSLGKLIPMRFPRSAEGAAFTE